MPFQIVRSDITHMHVDAIVNAANKSLAAGGGVSGAIHAVAGPELAEECRRIGGCHVGKAVITGGYRLPAKHVIHTVGPVWQGGARGEKEALTSCYLEAMKLAAAYGLKSIAFPVLASGAYGYPKDQAIKVATDAISDFLFRFVPDNDLMVYLVTFTRESLLAAGRLFADIRQYIDDHYVETHFDFEREYFRNERFSAPDKASGPDDEDCLSASVFSDSEPSDFAFFPMSQVWSPDTIEDALCMIDESFSQMILRKIREKGMKNADCYKKANIDKKLFSKIVTNEGYKPKKTTALALAIALELSLEETRELLMKAGMAISHSDKFDIIVEFFISRGKYDIFEINEALYSFDQPLLGGALL